MPTLRKLASVALMVKGGNQPAKATCRNVEQWLRARGVCVLSCGCNDGSFLCDDCADADLVLVFGGDGTIVTVAHDMLGTGIALAGVNFGQVGFLAELSEENWQRQLGEVLEKGLLVEPRMSLRYELSRNGRRILCGEVINDAVVTRGKVARLLNLILKVNDAPFILLRSDGLIFATPTGSSGYAGSAGGPILMPGLNAYVAAAICPYLNNFPPLVLSPETVFSVTVAEAFPDVYLTFDGHETHPLEPGDRLEVRGAPERFFMADFGLKNYFERLCEVGFVQTAKRRS
jgi:NAD+ kinase